MEDFTVNTGQSTGQQPPVQPPRRTPGSSMGIAALITAIVTVVLAVIPCVGLIAMIPGIIAIVLASIGLSQASSNNGPRGVLVAGLIIAIVATLISFSQIFVAGKITDKFKKNYGGEIENVINDVQENVLNQIEDANVSIKVETNNDTVEINTKIKKQDRHQELEELENAKTESNDTLGRQK
jgi:hypothetical protein